ncbi:DEDD exonuclease domain-containing protein [Mycobacterium vicinigordonae]|uniref:DEDD exonuclease domain-containing protein n=1 Tax=Mycobacterium vicinigordonae TaxID=1719132 RepID=A0A7D6INY6_9MYCO|nr:DEDD exonuclease domain-containing protein [Mycobacterium vicinigordonae]
MRMPNVTAMGATGATQLSFTGLFDELEPSQQPHEQSLRETTFVVVDLETTGGRAVSNSGAAPDAITEIGAVKVCGGAVLGEFATLVDPGRSIPPQIVQLTGITTAMVCDAPTIDAVLPMFFEFAGDAVLVAHNAGFDIGFLRAAAERCQLHWPRPKVLCTVRLARRVLSREEAPSVRLAELARLFAVTTQPTHRALDDARATVDVLHALIERVGNQGIHTYTDLRSYLPDVTPAQRRKRVLADGLPHRPGVYLFRGPSGEVLYIGTGVDLRRRVSQYFTGADPRGRMKEMVGLAESVDHVECAHSLEAGVRELRLLASHAPPYNRRSRFPHRWWWVALTDEAFPRLSVVRNPRHDRAIGPFRSRTDAADTAALLARFAGVRTCTRRLARSARHGPACPELEVSPCPAARDVTPQQYAAVAVRVEALIDGTDNAALAAAADQVSALAERHHYESAARLRDHLCTTVEVLWRGQRLRALTALPELIAAAPDGDKGYELVVIRHGQLAAAGVARRGVPPMPVIESIAAGAQTILPSAAPLGGALVEETALIARWLTAPGVRIVRVTSENTGWASPLRSAGAWAGWAAAARSAKLAAEQLDSHPLTEPHPTREQLFGRPAVDRGDGAAQPVFPSRQPFSATG